MNNTKNMFASKTVWTGIAMLVYNALALFGILPEGLTEESVLTAVNSVGAIAAIIFRKTAKTELTVGG